jgi:hypothetical protein
VVPRRLAGCAPAVGHRGVPLGAACCRAGARKGDVRPWLLLGGRDRDGGGCEGVSIRVPLISILIHISVVCLCEYKLFRTLTTYFCRSSTWYKQAADLGDRRAMQRLKGGALPPTAGAPGAIVSRDSGGPGEGGGAVGKGGKDKEKDCVIM